MPRDAASLLWIANLGCLELHRAAGEANFQRRRDGGAAADAQPAAVAAPAGDDDAMNATIARLHSFEPAAIGLADFGRGENYVARQVERWSKQYRASETEKIDAMERLIDDGQIRFAGVSNFDVAELKAAQAAMRHHKLAANQVLYHLKERGIERKLIP